MIHPPLLLRWRALLLLSLLHITVIASSNYLVQIPFQLFGFHTTWGAFTYPFIFVATDLTVRLFGAAMARRIIFCVMFPALVLSYLLSVLFQTGQFTSWQALTLLDLVAARVVLASFTAYVTGQLLDIFVFRRLMRLPIWWLAPAASAVFGTLVDTLVFFSVAFYHSSNGFMASHWPEIAAVDYAFKLLVSVMLFVPLYGILLNWLKTRIGVLTKTPSFPAEKEGV